MLRYSMSIFLFFNSFFTLFYCHFFFNFFSESFSIYITFFLSFKSPLPLLRLSSTFLIFFPSSSSLAYSSTIFSILSISPSPFFFFFFVRQTFTVDQRTYLSVTCSSFFFFFSFSFQETFSSAFSSSFSFFNLFIFLSLYRTRPSVVFIFNIDVFFFRSHHVLPLWLQIVLSPSFSRVFSSSLESVFFFPIEMFGICVHCAWSLLFSCVSTWLRGALQSSMDV